MRVSIKDKYLILSFGGARMIFGGHKKIEIPIEKNLKIRQVKQIPKYKGIRRYGINIPGFFVAGIFLTLVKKEREFWNVYDSKKAVEIFLQDYKYSRIVIDVDNPQKVIEDILNNVTNPNLVGEINKTLQEDISIKVKNRTIDGTLTYPDKKGKYPAILLIAGSGPTDRDWNSPKLPGKNGSGALIANELTLQGFVTFRYDKMGTGKNLLFDNFSWQDYHDEQCAAIDFLSQLPYVEKKSILILGHSEGALHAMHLVNTSKNPNVTNIAGLILLAPPGRKLRDIILDQICEQLNSIKIYSKSTIETQLLKLSEGFDLLVSGRAELFNKAQLIFPLRKIHEVFFKKLTRNYTSEVLDFDPKNAISRIKPPVLIVIGAADKQVDVEKDARALFDAAINQGKNNVKFVVLPQADHVFKYEAKAKESLSAIASLYYNAPERFLNWGLITSIMSWTRSFLRNESF